MLVIGTLGNALPLVVIALILLAALAFFCVLPELIAQNTALGRLSGIHILCLVVAFIAVAIAMCGVCYVGRNSFSHVVIGTYGIISSIVGIAGAISITIET